MFVQANMMNLTSLHLGTANDLLKKTIDLHLRVFNDFYWYGV